MANMSGRRVFRQERGS